MARNCCRYFTVSLVPTAAFILAVLFGCGILLLPILYTELAVNYVYGAVIDAGSSHTTLYIYRWEVPTQYVTNSKTGNVEEIFHCPLNPSKSRSINSYANNTSAAPEAFTACLKKSYKKWYGESVVPDDQRQYTPLYLGATAGMRLVSEDNDTVSGEIMTAVANALKNETLSYYKFKEPKIISGEQEAASGWITANYLYNNCTAFQPTHPAIGSLDLGGASTQIAFQNKSVLSSNDYLAKRTLFGTTYDVYARSFLCYGENQAYSRFLAHLIGKHKNVTTNVPNPCVFSGASVTVPSSDIYTTCVNSTTASNVFGHQLYPPLMASSEVSFVGTGDLSKCQAVIKDVFFNFCQPAENCVNGKFVPPPVAGQFFGFSAFYYTANYFNSSNSMFTRSTGWGTFMGNVSTFCNLSHETAQKDYDQDKFLYTRCFVGQFMGYLLENGFGFTNKTSQDWSVQFKEKLDKKSLGWALGYILEKTNSISQAHYTPDRPYTAVDLVVGIIILSILCVIFVVFFFLTFYACRKALKTRSGYQNI